MPRKKKAETPPSPAADPAGVICVLVHGTWGRNAPFLQADSRLQQTFREQLRGQEVVFHNFMWSGRNSIVARSQAARDLRQELERLQQEHPARKMFVAAHSHGGNVVLYALRDEALARGVCGLVFFGVPMLVCEATGFPKIGLVFLSLNVLTGAALMQSDWIVSWENEFVSRVVNWIDDSSVAITLTVILSIFATLQLSGIAMGLLDRLQQRIMADLKSPDLSYKTFFVTAHADEAALGLRALRFLADLPAKLPELAELILGPLGGAAFFGVMIAMVLTKFRLLIPADFFREYAEPLVLGIVTALGWIIGLSIGVSLAAKGLCALLGVPLGTGVGFGWARIWVHLMVHMRVETLPRTVGPHMQHAIPAEQLKGIKNLRHSHTYQHGGALEAAGAWIRATSRGAPAGSQGATVVRE